MSKKDERKDVSNENLFKWDDYKGKTFDEALPAIYSHAVKIADSMRTWYWKSIMKIRPFSRGIRLVTVIIFIIGTILPILAGLINKPNERLEFTQLGVVALAIAGLLQIADRYFGWSSGWMRYITTVTAMENLTRKFELEWAKYIIDKGNAIGNGDTKPLFDIAVRFEDEISKMQSDETDKWVVEFNSSNALLGELIKSQREATQETIKNLHAASASQKNGSVEVTIIHKAAPIAVNIAIDNEPAQVFVGSSWGKQDLKPGHHTITITPTGGTPQTIQKIVNVPPGDIAKTEVKLS